MYYPRSRQTIENILIGLRRDILILSIRKHKLTDNAAHMINILDLHLSEMVDQIREIYKEEKINIKQTTKFANYLKQVFKEAIGQVDTRQAFEEEETELVHHVKNQFIEIIREVDSIITT